MYNTHPFWEGYCSRKEQMKATIAAIVYVSLSEIQKVNPLIDWEYVQNNKDNFDGLLFNLGMDVYNYPYEVQNVQHRNKFNEVVVCERFVGNERTDKQWLTSGNASQEALDKAGGNKLLADLYAHRGASEVE